ncbi:MAG: metallophosphoesterase family protein [Saprospiraceae bacterium]|uniref:Phosphoesterase n=1 Tax=Candidatus Opimibacter skivensis TaxID=2982028 RepID=A0A9D7XRN7_9BACT|nr:metallophosphoesterase family protein [Candidatus Opimibacter skivensis]
MTRIGLLSDTHGFLDESLKLLLEDCDEIWHAGDFGTMEVYKQLVDLKKPFKGVYGNIDGQELRTYVPLDQLWQVEEMKIFMTHIGGYPGKYTARVKNILLEQKPDIYVCGHSHILKVIYDKNLKLLHLNPGACGKEGFHKVRTALKFNIDGDKVSDMGIIELSPRQG